MISDAAPHGRRPRIRAHVEEHLGPVKQVFHSPAATDAPPIDVLHVAPSVERPVRTLVTCGMSDLPMDTHGDRKAPRHLELMMTLPREWQLDEASADKSSHWPVHTLVSLAQWPHVHGRALKWGDTVPNGDPPSPYAAGTKLCGVILAPSLLVQKEFYALSDEQDQIEFYAAIPLYAEELQLRQDQGMERLLSALIDRRINDLVEVKRHNVTRKRFGLF